MAINPSIVVHPRLVRFGWQKFIKEATYNIKSCHLNHFGSDEAVPDSKRFMVDFADQDIRQHALQIGWINSAAVWHVGCLLLAVPPCIKRADQIGS